ncbi:MAG: CHAT domain-containing protein [Endomicrobiales bacterium]
MRGVLRGSAAAGAGAIDIGTAFLFAGSRNVVAGLWPVPSEITARFFSAYLKGTAGGKKAPDALSSARDEIRGQGFEHPFYWAGFVLLAR